MTNVTLLLNSNLFDSLHYAQSARKTFSGRESAAQHYLNKGWKLGYSPGSQFDTPWFLRAYPSAAISGVCPLLYYLKYADKQRMYPSQDEQQKMATLIASSLFDHVYYGHRVGMTFDNRFSAARHYLAHGGASAPSRYFDAAYYLRTYQDVAHQKTNPLLHYEQRGAWEGRQPHGEIHNEALQEADALFRRGCLTEAKTRLGALINSLENDTPAQDAATLLNAEIALLCGDYQATEAACQALLNKGWKALRPLLYNRACGVLVQALCEQGRYQCAQASVVRAYQHLKIWHAAALTRLRQALITQADLALFAGIVAPAIAKNDAFTTHAFTTHALLQYSLAARDTGNTPLALELIKQRYVKGVSEHHAFGDEPPAADVSWQAEARLALVQMKECLDSAGITFFLISGTLLGCIRDDDIISHDKDIDIGVMAGVPLGDVKAAFRGTGRFTVLPDIHDKLIRVRHANGVMADVFVHWEYGGRLYHEGRKTGWWNTAFSLVKTDFIGGKYLIPDNAELYLEENYGNWKVPDKNFDTFADTPNMYTADRAELIWYCYKQLLEEYKAGNIERYRRIWSALCKSEDPSLTIQTTYHLSI